MRILGFSLVLLAAEVSPQFEASSYANECKICHAANAKRCSQCKVEHYCSTKCQKQDRHHHRARCAEWAPFKPLLPNVRIAPSSLPNAGRGLFANQNIAVAEPIAIYWGKRISRSLELEYNDLVQDTEKGPLMGDSNPPAPHLAAQLVNDGYLDSNVFQRFLDIDCKNPSPILLRDIETFSAKYIFDLHHDPKHNATLDYKFGRVFFQTDLPVLVSTRNIIANEEILYRYGLGYWISMVADICTRKGLPIAGLDVFRAASIGIENFVAVQRKLAKGDYPTGMELKYFHAYMSRPQYETHLATYESKLLEFRLSGLFPAHAGIHLRISDANEFDQIVHQLKVKEALEEIGNAPNSDFSSRSLDTLHPKSRALLKSLLPHSMKDGKEVFYWLSEELPRTLSNEEVLRFLRHGEDSK